MPRAVPSNWPDLSDDELLNLRLADLPLTLKGTVVETWIDQLKGELAARGLNFPLHFYLSDEWFTPDGATAIAHGKAMLAAGADILDVGGESTRPGAAPVSPQDEAARVLPVVRALSEAGAIVSIDTRHAAVMDQAVKAGARIINDVTALTGDPDSPRVAAQSGAALVLMHMLGEPQTMQQEPRYADVTCDLIDYFTDRLAALAKASESAQRLMKIEGMGPVTATALLASVGDAKVFHSGRQFAAWLELHAEAALHRRQAASNHQSPIP